MLSLVADKVGSGGSRELWQTWGVVHVGKDEHGGIEERGSAGGSRYFVPDQVVSSRQPRRPDSYVSPLRYPGGKRRLAKFIARLVRDNRLLDGDYAEVYAGGAAVALSLLYGEYVKRIHINDLDPGIHAFWLAASHDADRFCRLIEMTPLTIEEWDRQRAIQNMHDPDPLELGFSTFYLNRTNRSGIITGGVIGGREQTGRWTMDARFDRQKLVRRIQCIGRNRSRIDVTRLDGAEFLQRVVPRLPERSFLYLDPPYFLKGKEDLYSNFYSPSDHAHVAQAVQSITVNWMVSYDDTPEIRQLYPGVRQISYDIHYSAQERRMGREIAFFSEGLQIPNVDNPCRMSP